MKYLNLFFQKTKNKKQITQLQVRGDKFKEWNAENRIEKCSFFNEISLQYKETKLPQDYMERGKKSNLTDRDL